MARLSARRLQSSCLLTVLAEPHHPLILLFQLGYIDFHFFFSSRRRHTRLQGDWSSDVCSSDLSRSSRELSEQEDRKRETESTRSRWESRAACSTWWGATSATPSAQELMRACSHRKIGRASCRERV